MIPGGNSALTELWNGTNWTEVNDMDVAKSAMGCKWNTTLLLIAYGGSGTPAEK